MIKEGIVNFSEGYEKEIYESALELKKEAMPQLPMELFGLYEKTGDRKQYDGVYLTRRKYLAVFGLLALQQKYEKGFVPAEDRDILAKIMEEICREECWAVPAHVDRTNPNWQITADLFACETAQTLAELSDRLQQEIPEGVRNTVRENIEKRIFRPFFLTPAPAFWWEEANTNWNAVCAGAIGSACLHLMQDDSQRLENSLERIIKALTHYMDGFAEDGVCLEGLGYYTYGMTYLVNFAQELYEYSGGKRNLFAGAWSDGEKENKSRAEKLHRMAGFLEKCFFRDGRMLCFSDDCSEDTFRLGMYCVMAMHYPNLLFPPLKRAAGLHADFCYRFAALKMDLLYTSEYVKRIKEEPLQKRDFFSFHVFSTAQWCVGNAASGVGFACKGGHNGEPHNHNDIGHFIYEKDGVMFLTDLGAGEYTGNYFGENRYSILCNSSYGHSVPVIKGMGQCTGEMYRCTEFQADGCADRTGKVEIQLELGNAYPEKLLSYFNRKFCFDLQSGELRVEDCFHFYNQEITEAEESLITRMKPLMTPQGVVLAAQNMQCMIVPEGIGPEQIYVKEYIHRNHKREDEKVYAIRWKVLPDGQKVCCRFRVLTG